MNRLTRVEKLNFRLRVTTAIAQLIIMAIAFGIIITIPEPAENEVDTIQTGILFLSVTVVVYLECKYLEIRSKRW